MMMGYYGGGFGWLGMLVPLILIVLVVYFLFQLVGKNGESSSHAHAILAERFARGEITEEEYLQMKRALKKK